MSSLNCKHARGHRYFEITSDPKRETILLLHGFGANASDLLSLNEVLRGPNWIFPEGTLEVPLAPDFTGKAWFPLNMEKLSSAIQTHSFEEVVQAFPPNLREAKEGLLGFIEELQLDWSKLILGGFSQGAVLALETAFAAPKKCKGLLLFSGTLLQEESWKKQATFLKDVLFFQSHGMYDPLLPFTRAKALETLLLQAGLKGKLHSFEGGHTIPSTVLSQLGKTLSDWKEEA